MTARIAEHIDLDHVDETPWACGPYTRRALVAATRALVAVVEAEDLDRFAPVDVIARQELREAGR